MKNNQICIIITVTYNAMILTLPITSVSGSGYGVYNGGRLVKHFVGASQNIGTKGGNH